MAAARVLAATRPETVGRAFNVLDGEVTSIGEFTRVVADVYVPVCRFRSLYLPF